METPATPGPAAMPADAALQRKKRRRLRLLIPFCSVVLVAIAGAILLPMLRARAMKVAVEDLANCIHWKVNYRDYADKVAQYGDSAVPLVIEKYNQAEPLSRTVLVYCLCRISTDKSLAFVRKVMAEHADRLVASSAISDYPIGREDDIIPILIDLEGQGECTYYVEERFTEMIIRKPNRAGALVAALQNVKDGQRFSRISYFLEKVSQHTYRSPISMLPSEVIGGQDAKLLREWWSSHKDKDFFAWTEELLKSPWDESRSDALQMMRHLRDPRAMPYFIKALDDASAGVRYWAVCGLLSFQSPPANPEGLRWETFQENEKQIIASLKKDPNQPPLKDLVPPISSSAELQQ